MTADTVSLPGLACRESQAEPGTWLYRAREPHPELAPDGAPTAMLVHVAGGARGTLQLGVRLDPPGAEIEKLRAAVAEARPEVDPDLIRLASDVRSVDGIRLTAQVGGSPVVLAESAGSGFPPYAAILQVALDADGAAAVASALRGGRGRLSVTYDLTLTDGTRTRAEADVGAWFAASSRDHVVVAPPAPTPPATTPPAPPRSETSRAED